MATGIRFDGISERVYFPAPTVKLTFTNTCSNLKHLVVYDYESWSRSKDDETHLFAIDDKLDNMREATVRLDTTTEIYLVRAYFDDGEDLEIIVHLGLPHTTLNLSLNMEAGSPVFNVGMPATKVTIRRADEILNS